MPRGHLTIVISCCLLATIGCAPEPEVSPCYTGTDPLPAELEALIGEDLVDCSQLEGVVCNDAVTVDEACLQASQLRSELVLPVCAKAPGIDNFHVHIGTCQPPDIHGGPCAKDTDCRSDQDLLCSIKSGAYEGLCEPDGYPDLARLVYIYKRRSDLSPTEFLQYWHDHHAPSAVQNAETLGIETYLQLHTTTTILPIIDTFLQGNQASWSAFDGAAEYYVNPDTFSTALGTSEGQQALQDLIDDKSNFADLSQSAVWLGEEHVLRREPRIPGEPAIIFTWVGNGLNPAPAAFQDRYLEYGSFVVSLAELLGIHEYIQVHTMDTPLNNMLQTMHGTSAPYPVHAGFLWDFSQAMTPEALPVMLSIFQLEPTFIDFSKSAIWFAQEHIIIPLEY